MKHGTELGHHERETKKLKNYIILLINNGLHIYYI